MDLCEEIWSAVNWDPIQYDSVSIIFWNIGLHRGFNLKFGITGTNFLVIIIHYNIMKFCFECDCLSYQKQNTARNCKQCIEAFRRNSCKHDSIKVKHVAFCLLRDTTKSCRYFVCLYNTGGYTTVLRIVHVCLCVCIYVWFYIVFMFQYTICLLSTSETASSTNNFPMKLYTVTTSRAG